VSGGKQGITLLAGRKQATVIRIVLNEILTDRINDTLRHLSSRWTVKKRCRLVTCQPGECRKLTADSIEVVV